MINVNFQNYSYYPFLHTRNSEEEAFVNLSQEDKLSILPSFVLHNRKGTALTASLEKIHLNIILIGKNSLQDMKMLFQQYFLIVTKNICVTLFDKQLI